jgi:hypothetical protein
MPTTLLPAILKGFFLLLAGIPCLLILRIACAEWSSATPERRLSLVAFIVQFGCLAAWALVQSRWLALGNLLALIVQYLFGDDDWGRAARKKRRAEQQGVDGGPSGTAAETAEHQDFVAFRDVGASKNKRTLRGRRGIPLS